MLLFALLKTVAGNVIESLSSFSIVIFTVDLLNVAVQYELSKFANGETSPLYKTPIIFIAIVLFSSSKETISKVRAISRVPPPLNP